jgi:hypothetical protein
MMFGSLAFHSQKHKKLFLRVKNDKKIYPRKVGGNVGEKERKTEV